MPASNESAQCGAVGVSTADATAPSVPANLQGTGASASQINLTWTASTDNVGVTGYRVYRNGSQVGTTAVASYSDTGLSEATSYSYRVAAYDAAGNTSAQCTAVAGVDAGCHGPVGSHEPAGRGGLHIPDRSFLDGLVGQRGGDRLQGLP